MKNFLRNTISIVMTLIIFLGMIPTAHAAATRYSFDATNIDYRAWSQDQLPWGIQKLGDASEYGGFNKAGCLFISFAKLAVQAGVRKAGEDFNPAVVNRLFEENDVTDSSGQMYVDQRSLAAELVGLKYEKEIKHSDIMSYMNDTKADYYVILYKSGHFVPIDKATTLNKKEIYYHESWTFRSNDCLKDYEKVAKTYSTRYNNEKSYVSSLVSKKYEGNATAVWLLSVPNNSTPAVTVKNCKHTKYLGGICEKCGYEAPYKITPVKATAYRITKSGGAPVWSRPYSNNSVKLRTMAKGSIVIVVGKATNIGSNGQPHNLWYLLSDGSWCYSGRVKKVSASNIYYVYNTDGCLNLNKTAKSGGTVLEQIPEGAAVEVNRSKSRGAWLYVKYNGKWGYAYSKYLTSKAPTIGIYTVNKDISGLFTSATSSKVYTKVAIKEGEEIVIFTNRLSGNRYIAMYDNTYAGYINKSDITKLR